MRIAVVGATGVVGHVVVALALSEGHEVVGVSRSQGVDLLDPKALEHALIDVRAIIDTSQSPSLREREATEFFSQAAANLGGAAHRAGVDRTVLFSIVGVDRSPDCGYYVAKAKQERAVREHAPGPVILHATQFHEFAGQMLDMSRADGTAAIMDVPS